MVNVTLFLFFVWEMHKVILSILFCVSICVCSQANSKLYISDCGDDSYLLHYKHVEASEFIRGKDVFINSEKVLLSANITSGTVTFDCLRNDVSSWFFYMNRRCRYLSMILIIAVIKKRVYLLDWEKSNTQGLIAVSLVPLKIHFIWVYECQWSLLE